MRTISQTDEQKQRRVFDPMVRIDPDLHQQLKVKAAVESTTVSALATKAVRNMLAEESHEKKEA